MPPKTPPGKAKILCIFAKIILAAVLSLLELVIAIMCLVFRPDFDSVLAFPAELNFYYFDQMIFQVGFWCLLLAPSAWLYTSAYPLTRWYSQIYTLILLSIFEIRLKLSNVFNKIYKEDPIAGRYSRDIMTPDNYKLLDNAEKFGHLIVLLLLVVVVILIIMVLLNFFLIYVSKAKDIDTPSTPANRPQ